MKEQRAPRISLNGRPVRVVCGQMVDFLDFDFSLPPAPKLKRPKCTCGAQAVGYKPYMVGHSDYCDVHHDKTPIGINDPYYEKDDGSTKTR